MSYLRCNGVFGGPVLWIKLHDDDVWKARRCVSSRSSRSPLFLVYLRPGQPAPTPGRARRRCASAEGAAPLERLPGVRGCGTADGGPPASEGTASATASAAGAATL